MNDIPNESESQAVKSNIVVPRTRPQLISPKKPNLLNKWIKESKNSYQITRKDIAYIYRNVIFTKTFGELKSIMEDEEKRDKLPALVITIIASVLGDIARGNILNLSRMLQFIFPNSLNGFDPDEFASKANINSNNELKDLEDTLRKLEGDDSLFIIDKLLIAEDQQYKVLEGTSK